MMISSLRCGRQYKTEDSTGKAVQDSTGAGNAKRAKIYLSIDLFWQVLEK